jgi:hypothetical protein
VRLREDRTMSRINLEGAIDLHCHYGPESVIGTRHSVDAAQAAREAAAHGFAAIVLKSHDFPSNAVAHAVQQAVPGIRVRGGICCDYWVGGCNPVAVETALRDGAAIVWLPTISSRQDVENGTAAVLGLPQTGIEILDEDGGLVAEVRQILELAEQYDAVVATGHTSAREHIALARAFGRRGTLLVTHAMNAGGGPRLGVRDCVELAELGAWIEITAATCMGSRGPTAAEVVEAIDAIGPSQVVLATDYGWNDALPHPAPGLLDYATALHAVGATEAQLREMACANPARLLRMA